MVQKTAYVIVKRAFDIVAALVALVLLTVPLFVISLVIKCTSQGPIIHWSKRIGKNNTIFSMAKFRTMYMSTPQVATHLLDAPAQYVTPIGKVLRKYSLDELPQLYNILKGDISFVGPRPALFNQDDLKELRTQKDIHLLVPGLTGWAQINGRDELPIPEKVSFDEEYFKRASFVFDMKIICLTLVKVIRGDNVSH
jgi:O-antigen biosynthesis protein WbqP